MSDFVVCRNVLVLEQSELGPNLLPLYLNRSIMLANICSRGHFSDSYFVAALRVRSQFNILGLKPVY